MKNLNPTKKAFAVSYTKKVGGQGELIVKGCDEANALQNAKYLCFTGSNFKVEREVNVNEYVKPSQLGYAGSGRSN